MKDRCPLERLWLSSWGQLAARLAAAPPGAAAAPGPAASRDASAQVLCGFGARRPPSWTPARPHRRHDVILTLRPMVRWALPGGLVAVVVATIALAPARHRRRPPGRADPARWWPPPLPPGRPGAPSAPSAASPS